jgi:hypothetical protein
MPTGSDGMPELADRDHIYVLDLPFDPESQLRAIYGLLVRNQKADEQLTAEIRAAEEHAKKLTGIWNEHAVDECVDMMHDSVYQDATHSMSALGMLAPFIEGIFAQCFVGIGNKFFATGSPPSAHDRWKLNAPEAWDVHYQYINGRLRKSSIVESAKELAVETGLQKYLPADIWTAMTALFAYRNKMFHNGMEWPEDERKNFQSRIVADNWPSSWFSQATSGGEPWVFYMTQEFIDRCYDLANKVLDAFGRLIKRDLWSRIPRES